VTGALLLVVADALQRRNRGACYLAIGLLSLGAGLLALRAQWTQATVLGAGALLMVAARGAFYRPAALSDEPWSWRWIVSVGLAVVATVWLLLFVHKHVEYRNELWWRFALDADAPRALRATLGAVLVLLGFAFWRLMRPARHRVPLPAETQIDSLVPLVEAAPDVQANLVLTGDKAVLQIPGTEGFVMYQRRGRTLVAMGDPVGPPESRERLRWAFRELADREGLLCAFYEIGRGDLEGYLDLGLTLVKLGEEAVVTLDGFSLEGKARAPLRQARNRGIRQGLEFRVVPPEEVPDLLDVLERISQSWLSTKGSAEKGFSLGFFSRSYLRRTAIALVTRHGEPLAFANLWFANRGRAASVDLMRHDFEAPPGVMDYLFVELLSWARSHGCETFSLGMAPLSGLATHRLASRWQRLLGFAAARGDNVYNFAGLRHFKAKFGPRWQARYLAASGGHRMAVVLLDVTRLIAAPPLPAAGAGHAVRDAPAIQSRVAATAGRP
jgi:phosphatidylglycerol lysyltransferase